MSIAWYICPYDTVIRDEDEEGIIRRPGMSRYIPRVPNADGADWYESEILGNHILVKVSAPTALHVAIQADSNFIEIPVGRDVSVGSRLALNVKLKTLGYTQQEIDDTGWETKELLELLLSVRSAVRLNIQKDGFQWTSERQAGGSSLVKIDARIAG